MLDTIKSLFAGINRLVTVFTGLMMHVLVIMVALQVFSRFVIESALPWTEELARLSFIWLCFLGLSVCVFEKSNLGIEFIYNRVGPSGKKSLSIIVEVLMLFLFGIITIFGAKLLVMVSMQISPTMGYNMAYAYLPVQLGGALSFIYTVVNLIDVLGGKYEKRGEHA
jgi:TRAP-type C4-dicarboxylate transport system permease small subunit